MNFVYVRDKSDDKSIWSSVLNDDEYRVPQLQAQDVVLDIGMHTGSFVARAFLAGSRRIYGFEPDPDNYRLAMANIGFIREQFDGGQFLNEAIGRSDERALEPVYLTPHIPMEHELNTGVGNIFADASSGKLVPCSPFDLIVGQLQNVRLCKMDCEGGEYPILYTSKLLSQVQEFVGEWHQTLPEEVERGLNLGIPCDAASLCEYMAQHGFSAVCFARNEDMPKPLAGNFRFVRGKAQRSEFDRDLDGNRQILCASGF